jgi:hypothetical protein
MKPYNAKLPWLLVGKQATSFVIVDTRTNEQWEVPTIDHVHQIAADRSSQQGAVGLGDLVHRATSALGIKRCAPCAKRQAALNAMIGRVPGFRR